MKPRQTTIDFYDRPASGMAKRRSSHTTGRGSVTTIRAASGCAGFTSTSNAARTTTEETAQTWQAVAHERLQFRQRVRDRLQLHDRSHSFRVTSNMAAPWQVSNDARL
jgi:hypothetical protein